jgi:hypothetical protein
MAEQDGSERTVARVRRAPGADIVATVVASIAIALPLVFYLHQHVEILRLGYEIESLEGRRVELAERSRELRVKRMQSASFERVEHEAQVLGLAAPDPKDVYVASLPAGSSSDAPAARPATREPRMTARLE